VGREVGPDRREALGRELAKAEAVYRALEELGGRATVGEVATRARMGVEEVYYLLTKLNEKGFLLRERDEGSLALYFRVVRELKPEELLGVEVYVPPGEPDIYVKARRVKGLIDRYGIRADLIGSCKVHLAAYPYHSRLTADVDVVAATVEEAREVAELISDHMGLSIERGWVIDYKLPFDERRSGGVDVSSIGLKKSLNNVIWGFWSYFKNYRGLLLEHTVVSKLMRPYFNPTTDGYDVLKGLIYSDVEVLAKLTRDAFAQAGEYAESIRDNLKLFLRYYESVEDRSEELRRDLELAKRILGEYRKVSLRKYSFATRVFEVEQPRGSALARFI